VSHLIVRLVAHLVEQWRINGIGLGVERVKNAAHYGVTQRRSHRFYDTIPA
jgi:hypothetical protein